LYFDCVLIGNGNKKNFVDTLSFAKMRYVLTTGTHCEQDFNTLEIPLGQLVMLALLSEGL
jgi:hypothetical protein